MSDFVVPGAIDMHCHFHPDDVGHGLGTAHSGVPVDEVLTEAAESGHAAVVLKSHSFASPQLATILDAAYPQISVYGGICTDYISGGLNVMAVESALNMGAKIVWLPTVHSKHDVEGANRAGFQGTPITCLDDDGKLVDEVQEIASLVKQTGAVLATGHISEVESYAVIKAFGSTHQILITHANEHLAGPDWTEGQLRELAELGALVELTALGCTDIPSYGVTGTPPAELAQLIAAVGAEQCTLASDYGYGKDFGRPGRGFVSFLERLWNAGVPEADIATMAATNPARLLGISS